MGTLNYGNTGLLIEIEDRALAHLQIVIVAKLRRNEGFPFSWVDPAAVGDGRSSIWMSSSIPLYFKYDATEPPMINRAWLEILTMTSNTASGLRVVEEPDRDASAPKLVLP